jgi:pimeloyl-ACP methyl ester carboxylesterase
MAGSAAREDERMKQTQLQIGADTIAVYESEGSGPAALLIHGNSADAQTFRHQLDGDFGAGHRLVAIDLPGHGQSSAAADPERTYSLPGYADVVVEVVERLQLPRPVIVGWSIGGHVALEAAERLPDAAGFFIYGAPPIGIPPAMERAFLPNPDTAAAFSPTVDGAQASAFANAFVRPGADAPPAFREAILNTDGRARAFVGASVVAANYTDEVQVVATMSAPLAIAHGAEEQIVNLDYLRRLSIPSLWRGDIQIIPGAGHAPHWEQPERFNTLLTEFVADAVHGR